MQNPIGIEQNPLFGWRMQAKGGQQQTAYRIVVAASQEKLAQEEYLWDSGRTESGSSVAVPYQGNNLFGRHGLCVEGICLGRGWKYDREHGDRGV